MLSIQICVFPFPALVVLESGLEIEQLLLDLQNTKFQDCVISIDRCETEKLLCCAHLPSDYTVEKFRALVAPFCAVKKCFLYRSQTTSKYMLRKLRSFLCYYPTNFQQINSKIFEKLTKYKYMPMHMNNIHACVLLNIQTLLPFMLSFSLT